MRGVRVLVVLALLSALTACNSDEGSSGWGFRNLGKRGDSDLDGKSAAAAAR
jgi:hypothetical protein